MKNKKGCLITLIIIVVLFIFGLVFGINQMLQHPENFREKSKVSIAFGISGKNEKIIEKILNDCGINDIESIKHDELLDNLNIKGEKGYRVTSNGISNIILYLKPNNTVNMIRYADNYLYKNGKIRSVLQDYILTIEEGTKYQLISDQTIKALLKAPLSAKFPPISEYRFSKKNNIAIVQSYLDSQNSFGVMLRSEFQIKIRAKDLRIISIIFDGKEYVK
jgi:hypothetical protein